jgi:uncharacterized protein DUF4124
MRKWLILLSALLVTTAGAAPAWTWVDNEGRVHYSDRPVPGATRIELTGAQGFSAPSAAARASRAPSSAATSEPADAGRGYRSISIVSPTDQETLWNTGGSVNVQVSMDPGLRTGHRIDLVLDGQRRNLNTASTQLTLADVFRGAHSVAAVVIDASGAEVARSPAVTVMVQQTSVQNRPR